MNPITLATLIQAAAGLLVPLGLAARIRRREDAPYVLLLPGVIAALAVQIVGFLLELLLSGGLVTLAASGLGGSEAVPSLLFAGVLGLASGFLTAGALTAAFVYLAPGARTVRQTALVGVGFGGMEVALRAGLAALVLFANLDLVSRPASEWGDLSIEEIRAHQADLDAYFDRSPAEPLLEIVPALGRLALGITLAVLVGTMFRTGEIGLFFSAALWGALTTAGPLLFTRAGPLGGAIIWGLIGGASLLILRQTARRAPP